MDQQTALKLFENCAVLIIAGVPVGTRFGIDLKTFVVAEKFRGVKMIPDGPHFVHCSSKGAYGDEAPRVGFIHYFKRGEIVVREWDPEKEELRERTKGDTELEKKMIKENLKELDKFLAPYDFESLGQWRNLVDSITEDTVNKMSPEQGIVRTTVELLSCPDSERPRGSSSNEINKSPRAMKVKSLIDEEDLLPNLKSVPGTAPRFSEIPERCPKTATPAEISKHHMDSIVAVEKFLEKRQKPVIEEIQFAFILFLCGHSVESLHHWRKILQLLCNSEEATVKYKSFYKNYLTVLLYQLPELPLELMEPTPSNTVYQDVKKLLVNCTLAGLNENCEILQNILRKKMLWTFDDILVEDPEDMPVIVEL